MTTIANLNQPNRETTGIHQCLADDDQRGFSMLYDRYSGAMYGMIIKWIKDGGTAENLLQDVFVKAWRNRQQYDAAKGSLFTWLYNIARNICIDHLRSKSHRYDKASLLNSDLPLLLPEGLMTVNGNPDTIGLRNLLNRLNEGEQQVIKLMYFKGYTQKEISQITAMPLGTVKTRMNRAIRNLRSFLKKDWDIALQHISMN